MTSTRCRPAWWHRRNARFVEQGGGRAAVLVAVLHREVLAHDLLDSHPARGHGVEALALFA